MRLLKVEVTNFGSYPNLEFTFENQGLSLIHGATGSGKSTLQDAPTWCLFGVTAKNGSVDDIRSWTNPNEPTTGAITVVLPSYDVLTITRIRGKSSQNDLYWTENEDLTPIRGKDITETQKLLEGRLGVSKEVYLAAAYYNEFSSTANFFTANAKDRRSLFEKLSNLELPTVLSERITSARKDVKKTIITVSEGHNKAIGRLEQLKETERTSKRDVKDWAEKQKATIEAFQVKSKNFEIDKANKIQKLLKESQSFEDARNHKIEKTIELLETANYHINHNTSECEACGQPNKTYTTNLLNKQKLESELQHLKTKVDPSVTARIHLEGEQNTYEEKIKLEESRENPFEKVIERVQRTLPQLESDVQAQKSQLQDLQKRYNSLSHLLDLTSILRGELLVKSVEQIELETNRYLETYFDSELRVSFSLDGDDLETGVQKNSYDCVFNQLSKGQRSLLKLCFSVSVMNIASNKIGTHLNTLLFDEALDGLDNDLKVKAFNLFSELGKSHETVLVIEHNNELKNLFNKQYHVTLINDESNICEILE